MTVRSSFAGVCALRDFHTIAVTASPSPLSLPAFMVARFREMTALSRQLCFAPFMIVAVGLLIVVPRAV
jgi:hypothetical protein